MALKPKARESFLKQLSKAISEEKIDIDIYSLSDKELKELYLKLQGSRKCSYAVKKGNNFEEDMINGNLQFVSFTDTYKYGVRPVTFKEFLMLDEFAKNNPNKYGNIIKY